MSVALVLTRGKMNERLVLGKCCGKLNDRLWVIVLKKSVLGLETGNG